MHSSENTTYTSYHRPPARSGRPCDRSAERTQCTNNTTKRLISDSQAEFSPSWPGVSLSNSTSTVVTLTLLVWATRLIYACIVYEPYTLECILQMKWLWVHTVASTFVLLEHSFLFGGCFPPSPSTLLWLIRLQYFRSLLQKWIHSAWCNSSLQRRDYSE